MDKVFQSLKTPVQSHLLAAVACLPLLVADLVSAYAGPSEVDTASAVMELRAHHQAAKAAMESKVRAQAVLQQTTRISHRL